MAEQNLFLFKDTSIGRGGYYLSIRWDEGTNTIRVYDSLRVGAWVLCSSSSDVEHEELVVDNEFSEFEFCLSTTRVQFRSKLTFPYAERIDTASSPVCASGTGSLIVDVDVQDESEIQAEDGVIQMTAYANGIVTYEVANADYQAKNETGIFTGLPPGEYDIEATYGIYTFFDTVTVAAASLDDFGLYAQAAWKSSVQNKDCLLHIKRRGYSGSVESMCVSHAEPCSLSWRGTDSDFGFPPVMGASMDFTVKENGLRGLLEFYTTNDREFLVEYYENTMLKFRGYLLPEFYQSVYDTVGHHVRFTASDQIGKLKDVPFTRPNGVPYRGGMSLWEVLNACLKKTNLGMSLYSLYGMAPDPSLLVDEDWFIIVSLDAERFYIEGKTPSTMDVLQGVLLSLSARLLQVDGRWIFQQLAWAPTDTDELINPVGANIPVTLVKNTTTNARTGMVVRLGDSSQTTQSSANFLAVYEKRIPLGGLPEYNDLRNPDLYVRVDNRYVGLSAPLYWTTTAVIRTRALAWETAKKAGVLMDNGLLFRDWRVRYADCLHLVSTPVEIQAELDYEEEQNVAFLIYIVARCKVVNPPIRFRIEVKFQVGTDTLYLSEDGLSWQETASQRIYTFASDAKGRDVEIQFTTPVLPDQYTGGDIDSGYVSMRISEPYIFGLNSSGNETDGNPIDLYFNNSYGGLFQRSDISTEDEILTIQRAVIKPTLAGAELPTEITLTQANGQRYSTETLEIEVYLSGAYDGRNKELFYPYTLQFASATPPLWYRRDGAAYETEGVTLLEMAKNNLIQFRSEPKLVLDAAIRGEYSPFQFVRLAQDNNYLLYCKELYYLPHLDEYTATLVMRDNIT